MDSLEQIIESIGLPLTYRQWKPKKPPALPYIVYLFTDSANFGADNKVYHSIGNYDIELYSNEKDPAKEALIEAALTANDIYFEKLEAWIESESLYQVSYSVTI